MRYISIVAASLTALALAGCASTPPTAAVGPGTWRFDYDAGLGEATATLTAEGGAVLTKVSCRSPNGDVIIREYALAPPQEPETPTLSIASMTIAPAAHQEIGPPAGLTLMIPVNDPVWAALRPDSSIAIGSGKRYHWLDAGAGEKFADVLGACRQRGS